MENDWIKTHEAMVYNIAEKEKLIRRLINENTELEEEIRKLKLESEEEK